MYSVRLSSGVFANRHIDHLCFRQATVDNAKNSEHDSEAFADLSSASSHPVSGPVPAIADNPPMPPHSNLTDTSDRDQRRYPSRDRRPPDRYGHYGQSFSGAGDVVSAYSCDLSDLT